MVTAAETARGQLPRAGTSGGWKAMRDGTCFLPTIAKKGQAQLDV
jgi:hypothetical protein